MSCVGTDMPRTRTAAHPTPFAWTDLTWLLHRYHVSWGYYLDHGAQSRTDQPGRRFQLPPGAEAAVHPEPVPTDHAPAQARARLPELGAATLRHLGNT